MNLLISLENSNGISINDQDTRPKEMLSTPKKFKLL